MEEQQLRFHNFAGNFVRLKQIRLLHYLSRLHECFINTNLHNRVLLFLLGWSGISSSFFPLDNTACFFVFFLTKLPYFLREKNSNVHLITSFRRVSHQNNARESIKINARQINSNISFVRSSNLISGKKCHSCEIFAREFSSLILKFPENF